MNNNIINQIFDNQTVWNGLNLIINVIPDFFKNISGIHSFSYNSGVLVNDFATNESI